MTYQKLNRLVRVVVWFKSLAMTSVHLEQEIFRQAYNSLNYKQSLLNAPPVAFLASAHEEGIRHAAQPKEDQVRPASSDLCHFLNSSQLCESETYAISSSSLNRNSTFSLIAIRYHVGVKPWTLFGPLLSFLNVVTSFFSCCSL